MLPKSSNLSSLSAMTRSGIYARLVSGVPGDSVRPASSSALRAAARGAPLYPGHIPTSSFQKKKLAITSVVAAARNPAQIDQVAIFAEVTGYSAIRGMRARMEAHPVGRRILREKPRIRSDQVNLDYLRSLPTDTFGHAYANFMDAHGYSMDEWAPVQYVDDPELAYVMRRFRELHDFSHVLYAVPPTVFGEFLLKHIELAHSKLPVAFVSTIVGWFRVAPAEVVLAATTFVPWANRAGKKAAFVLNVAFEEEFETPLDELREKLNIEVAPPFPTAK